MDSWNKEMGFELPVIIEACNRGIAQHPHDVTFAYINGILKNGSNRVSKQSMILPRQARNITKQKTKYITKIKSVQC